MNKFDEMMAFLAARDPNFCQVVAVDAEFGVFGRAWCMEAQPTLTSRDGSGKGSFAVAVLELCRGAYWSNWWRFAPVSALWTPGVSEGLVRTGAKLRDLDVREMEASREEDVVHILAKIPDTDAFNASLQSLIFDSRSGLLAAWRDLDSSRQMGEAGRSLARKPIAFFSGFLLTPRLPEWCGSAGNFDACCGSELEATCHPGLLR
eukprot:s503_g5.t1